MSGSGHAAEERVTAGVGGDVGGDRDDLAVDARQVARMVGRCLLELLLVASVDDEVDAFFGEGFGARTTEPLARRAHDAPTPGDAEVHWADVRHSQCRPSTEGVTVDAELDHEGGR